MKNKELLNRIIQLLKELDLTISTAESCTGGLICSNLTNIDGSSEFVVGSIVSYMTRIKNDFLDIPRALVEKHDVVSEEVASYMASGVMLAFESDVSISITGYIDKEAYCAIFIENKEYGFRIDLEPMEGDRSEVKDQIVTIVLGRLKSILMNLRGERMRKAISGGI